MNRPAVALTLLAAAVLLFFPVSRMFTPQGVAFALPDVPMARVNPEFARQWRLLEQAREVLPPGVSYTVRHADLDSEMSLFMFSLGVLLEHQAFPTSYFNGARPDGAAAEYIIAMKPLVPDEAGLRVVARFREGTIYQRVRPGR